MLLLYGLPNMKCASLVSRCCAALLPCANGLSNGIAPAGGAGGAASGGGARRLASEVRWP